MYILLIFNDPNCEKINCFMKFNKINEIITWSNGIIRYSDVKKKTRVYKTRKSFFRVLFVSNEDEELYFKYQYIDLRKV
jgi:negative regulator of genetic competence, sporulation and motility